MNSYVRHWSINSIAAKALKVRPGIVSRVTPNVFDFDTTAPEVDDFNADIRPAIGLDDADRLILQPTRVVPRKGIELAIELLAALGDPRNVLVIPHQSGDEGPEYLTHLQRQASERHVRLLRVADRIVSERRDGRGHRVHSLWDLYVHADFATYPSLHEGFGNALLEIIHVDLAAMVNRYPVYKADIRPTGVDFVEIESRLTPSAVDEVAGLLAHPGRRAAMARHNRAIGQAHFSYRTLRGIVED